MVGGFPEPSSASLQASFSGQQLWHSSFEPKNHEEPLGKRAVSYAFTITASLNKSSMMGSLSSSFNLFSSIDNAMASLAGLRGQRRQRQRPWLLWLRAPATLQLPGLFWHLARLSLRASGSSQHCPSPRARGSEALRRLQPQPFQVVGAGRQGMKDIFNLHQGLAISIQRNCLTFLCD